MLPTVKRIIEDTVERCCLSENIVTDNPNTTYRPDVLWSQTCFSHRSGVTRTSDIKAKQNSILALKRAR